MPTSIRELPQAPRRLVRTKEREARAREWLEKVHRQALESRKPKVREWREALKTYEARPKKSVRNFPVEGSPNIVVPLAATAADAIYATLIDLVNNTDPPITVRANTYEMHRTAEALQRFINQIRNNEMDLREATNDAILDDVQLGTGVMSVAWEKRITKHQDTEVLQEGPVMRAIPLQDFLIPEYGPSSIQRARWVSQRTYMSEEDLELHRKLMNWRTNEVSETTNVDPMRLQREHLSRYRRSSPDVDDKFEIWQCFADYDYDGDGVNENVMFVWDRTSGSILWAGYNPYKTRPFTKMVYQRRAHLPYGLGVCQMLKDLQYEVSEVHNNWILNTLLVNSAVWIANAGKIQSNIKIWPGRVIKVHGEDALNQIKPFPMASAPLQASALAQSDTMGIAERRTGVGDVSLPRPSAVLGSRATATTTLTLQENVNKRFTPVFDSVRESVSEAETMAFMRYHERILAQRASMSRKIIAMRGEEDGRLILSALSDPQWSLQYKVSMTATNARINKEADKQANLQVITVLMDYYEKTVQVAQTISSQDPLVTPVVKETALKVHQRGTELIERALNSFDQIKDPGKFTVDLSQALDNNLAGQVDPNAIAALANRINGGADFGLAQGGLPPV